MDTRNIHTFADISFCVNWWKRSPDSYHTSSCRCFRCDRSKIRRVPRAIPLADYQRAYKAARSRTRKCARCAGWRRINSTICQKCSDGMKAARLTLKLAGKCSKCGNKRDGDAIVCSRCYGIKKQSTERLHKERHESGLCTRCGKPQSSRFRECLRCRVTVWNKRYGKQKRAA